MYGRKNPSTTSVLYLQEAWPHNNISKEPAASLSSHRQHLNHAENGVHGANLPVIGCSCGFQFPCFPQPCHEINTGYQLQINTQLRCIYKAIKVQELLYCWLLLGKPRSSCEKIHFSKLLNIYWDIPIVVVGNYHA